MLATEKAFLAKTISSKFLPATNMTAQNDDNLDNIESRVQNQAFCACSRKRAVLDQAKRWLLMPAFIY
jgi:hypothetical protein